ncbi:MAG: methyltransferase domain-containing protein [Vicinamibacteria bacterium]|nr:methyltransferase domain-containing protein [Vicinamibacteria bacterium]
MHRAFAHVIGSRAQRGPATLLDVGCGEGAFVRHVSSVPGLEPHGVDISAPSIELAAKASPEVLFVVANADRFLPYADQAFDFVTSIDSRVNAGEFQRVLSQRGLILVAVPGPDDLIELRERVQGGKAEKPRGQRVVEELGRSLKLAERTTVRDSRIFEPPVLRDLLTVTYRGFRHSERAAVESLAAMDVTLSHEVLAFEHR